MSESAEWRRQRRDRVGVLDVRIHKSSMVVVSILRRRRTHTHTSSSSLHTINSIYNNVRCTMCRHSMCLEEEGAEREQTEKRTYDIYCEKMRCLVCNKFSWSRKTFFCKMMACIFDVNTVLHRIHTHTSTHPQHVAIRSECMHACCTELWLYTCVNEHCRTMATLIIWCGLSMHNSIIIMPLVIAVKVICIHMRAMPFRIWLLRMKTGAITIKDDINERTNDDARCENGAVSHRALLLFANSFRCVICMAQRGRRCRCPSSSVCVCGAKRTQLQLCKNGAHAHSEHIRRWIMMR